MKVRLAALALLNLAMAGPVEAAPPQERMREAAPRVAACPPGFAMLQNSDTCVRISGRVRAEGVIRSPRARSSNGFETDASGRVQLDVRKPTEYGPLRAVIRVEGRR